MISFFTCQGQSRFRTYIYSSFIQASHPVFFDIFHSHPAPPTPPTPPPLYSNNNLLILSYCRGVIYPTLQLFSLCWSLISSLTLLVTSSCFFPALKVTLGNYEAHSSDWSPLISSPCIFIIVVLPQKGASKHVISASFGTNGLLRQA